MAANAFCASSAWPQTVRSVSRSMASTRLRRIRGWSSMIKTLLFILAVIADVDSFVDAPPDRLFGAQEGFLCHQKKVGPRCFLWNFASTVLAELWAEVHFFDVCRAGAGGRLTVQSDLCQWYCLAEVDLNFSCVHTDRKSVV